MTKVFSFLVTLALVAGIWLFQQTPGHAYTFKNRLLHAIKSKDVIDIPFKQLSGDMTETDILQRYAQLDLDCGNEPSNLGERSCYASVRKANGVDAWFVVFFFEKGHLCGLKLDILPDGHEAMMDLLRARFGAGKESTDRGQSEELVHWMEPRGVIGINQTAYDDEPSQVYWASMEKILKDVAKRRHI